MKMDVACRKKKTSRHRLEAQQNHSNCTRAKRKAREGQKRCDKEAGFLLVEILTGNRKKGGKRYHILTLRVQQSLKMRNSNRVLNLPWRQLLPQTRAIAPQLSSVSKRIFFWYWNHSRAKNPENNIAFNFLFISMLLISF